MRLVDPIYRNALVSLVWVAHNKEKEETKPIFLDVGYSICHWSTIDGKEKSLCLQALSFTMVRAMRFFTGSASTTQTFITSPTFTTSEGCFTNLSAMREMWTRPS